MYNPMGTINNTEDKKGLNTTSGKAMEPIAVR